MVIRQPFFWFLFLLTITFSLSASAEQVGSIRGVIYDKDFDAPMPGVQILIAETDQKAETSDQGNFLLNEVPPGAYTIVISKEGYTRQVKGDVVVSEGQMTEIEASLSGEFNEMEEFVVQDVQIGTGTEAALLDLRMESPALMDSVSSELMSQAGASDAASALKLVAGATVQDGKYAVVRGLPDRYVNSQMNSVRLPTADADKRAVQLDQFPSAVIESIQVSKTFTPDQQGDASGGAVNIVLKGIPDEQFVKFEYGMSFNSHVVGAGSDFLTNKDGGVNFWARDLRRPQWEKLGNADHADLPWDGSLGVSHENAPMDYKWSVSTGGKIDVYDDIKIGGFGSFFYKRDVDHHEDGIDDSMWMLNSEYSKGNYRLVPSWSGNATIPGQSKMGKNDPGDWDEYSWYSSLYDITESSEKVQWGTLGTVGIETDNHSVQALFMYTRDATQKVILAENTRGRETASQYYGKWAKDPALDGYKFTDPMPDGWYETGNSPARKNQSTIYTERSTTTLQLSGKHTIDFFPEIGVKGLLMFLSPEIDWTAAKSFARMYQPDKRFMEAVWYPDDPDTAGVDPYWTVIPTAGSSTGFIQRIWTNITEESNQHFYNLKLPFEQWDGEEGYVKFGVFYDDTWRTFEQDSFTNSNGSLRYYAGYNADLSDAIAGQTMQKSVYDVDYKAKQKISAYYYMVDLPVTPWLKLLGGKRFESTTLWMKNYPYNPDLAQVYYVETGTDKGISVMAASGSDLTKANIDFHQKNTLPSIGFELKPFEELIIRGTYSETIARPTFKELTPVRQQEYIGADIFVGNPNLKLPFLKNYDLRLDYTPYDGGLISVSYFYKKIDNPIEYVLVEEPSREVSFTTPLNYPEGKMTGYEFETRHQLGHFIRGLEGLGVGANATFIKSEVTVPDWEFTRFNKYGYDIAKTRPMMGAPEYLYNIFMTYDIKDFGTKIGLFYTVKGDTLVQGAGLSGYKKGPNYVPDVYEKEHGTLNFSLSQQVGEDWTVKFQAKNLLDTPIRTVYRSKEVGKDVTKTSYTKGVDFSLSVGAKF